MLAVMDTKLCLYREADAGGEVNFGDTLNGLSFSWQLSKELGWPFTAVLACSLLFIKKLTGKKKGCLRLCSNYTWHVNSQERRQSRKLVAKEDRREDQEWQRRSLNFSLYPLSLLALLSTGGCPTSPSFYLFFPPGRQQLSQLLLSDCSSFM